jgi:hypothetical protein
MQRRHLLRSIGLLGGTSLAGCLSTDGSSTSDATTADTDGDGVPDQHDYAPRDASVQSKSDVQRTTAREETDDATDTTSTSAATTASTTTRSPTTTTTSTTTTTATARNSLEVDTTEIDGRVHHFVAYSLREATVQIYADLLDADYPDGATVLVALGTYPSPLSSSEVLAYAESDVIGDVSGSDTRVTLDLDFDAPDDPFYLWAVLLPAGADLGEVGSGDTDSLCQTDRLTVSANTLQRSPYEELDGIQQTNYERINAEGCYLLEFSGRTFDTSWDAGFVVSKSGYVEKTLVARDYDYPGYVRTALSDGGADALGSILDDEAERNGITGDREKVEFLIDFVQNLPYVPDDVSAGVNEYPKYMLETVTEAGGDCEDSSILLASLLNSSPFGYGTVLLSLPGHMAVGVKGGEDVEGSYYEYEGARYFYVETTGSGWEVGEIPEEYQNQKATIYAI